MFRKFLLGAGLLISMMPFNYAAAEKKIYSLPEIANIEIKKQENNLGIKHFGAPKIEFKSLDPMFRGKYSHELDTIYVSETYATNDKVNPKNTNEVKNMVDHELGHYYADKLNESIGNGDWPVLTNYSLDQALALNLLNEGIAEWFKKRTNDEDDDPYNDELYGTIKVFPNDIYHIYSGGYHLVRPVLDKYKKNGIEYLILHVPNSDDLRNLPAYREKALEELGKTTKDKI